MHTWLFSYGRIIVLLCVFLLYVTLPSIQAEKHSLYYIYTALSKPVDLPGIYEFTAMGLLDDRRIDYYNSKDQRMIPTQHWMKEKMTKDYWENGTRYRKIKQNVFQLNLKTLKRRMHQSKSDLHVLQWRVGCEAEQQGNEFNYSKGIYEFRYDGENFLFFDDKESRWVAPADAAQETKRKWEDNPGLNHYIKHYLEKECVDWLNKYREYADEELRKTSPPEVRLFAKRSIIDKTKLNLTCLVTGFYPNDVMVIIRKYRTTLPEDEIESTGIRPNHDGSFQMRKSVKIKEDERAEYDCFVYHRTLKGPIITKWDGTCNNCSSDTLFKTGVLIGVVLALAVVAVLFYILKKKKIMDVQRRPRRSL